MMPAWGTRLNDRQIQALVAYIRSWEPTAPPVVPPVLEP
jgi:mono/diheme cytochrome c family protein